MLPFSLNGFLIECTPKPEARRASESQQQIVVVKAGKGAARVAAAGSSSPAEMPGQRI